jgi:hypothetical protein
VAQSALYDNRIEELLFAWHCFITNPFFLLTTSLPTPLLPPLRYLPSAIGVNGMLSFVGQKLVRFTTRYWLVAAAMFGVCSMWSNAATADVDQLLQQARAQAFQLRRDSATLESFTRSNVSWQSHAGQINTIRTHVNQLGQTLSQLQAARDSAGQPYQQAIDRMQPLLQELAFNTTAIIDHLSQNPKRLTDPTYREYLRANADLASNLAEETSNIVAFARAERRFQELKAKVG